MTHHLFTDPFGIRTFKSAPTPPPEPNPPKQEAPPMQPQYGCYYAAVPSTPMIMVYYPQPVMMSSTQVQAPPQNPKT
ncbi:hypothetical protein O0I10_003304 [Lichtheimia ornata]|uniref:Uncharacterized protein n=1 Tax=Lichtheimia ornata TaxID=688661 RepID=A0AAD7V9T1_9FUNG|nr:uncharacterized protein O0I10_003304 [Lichtheimia ornata]KAJ8661081.1 hypothetical protein O0I10_003304 [Lichtheimia ornata]